MVRLTVAVLLVAACGAVFDVVAYRGDGQLGAVIAEEGLRIVRWAEWSRSDGTHFGVADLHPVAEFVAAGDLAAAAFVVAVRAVEVVVAAPRDLKRAIRAQDGAETSIAVEHLDGFVASARRHELRGAVGAT